jgi:M6 family metalloprotease-like protein
MTRPTFIRSLACSALLLAACAPALAAQDVVEAARAAGVAPPADMLQTLREDPTAFEFQRAWRQKTERVRQQRAALESRQGPRLSVAQLSAAQAAVTGTFRVPVLMGLYAGTAAPFPQSDYQTRLFGPQQYSARTFYQEMSRGAFTLDGTVSPWLTLPQTAAYYQPGNGNHPQYGRTAEYLQHTLARADSQVNFGQFDNDGPDGAPNSGDDDGYVDAAAFVYPTAGMSCGGPGIWPHRWVYRAWWGAPYTTGDARAGGGFILVDDYLIQGGRECGSNALMQIGTFSHEMGHALALPDLYDTYGGDGTSLGLGEWDLMAGGNWRTQDAPAHMGAWSKDFLGWLNVETVTSTRTAYALPQVYTGGTVLRYDVPGTREYFLLEHRAAVGSDRNIHGAGMLVYHVDPAVIDSTRSQNRVNAHPRMGVALEQADGLDHLGAGTNRGDAGDVFPGSTARTTFGDAGAHNTRSNDGVPSGLELRGIGLSGGQLSFDFVVAPALIVPAAVQMRSRGDTAATANVALGMNGGGPVAYRARTARGSAWLTVSPDTGNAPGTLSLTARPQGLAPGVYRDTVVITSAGVGNSPVRTAVEYLVQPRVLVLGDSLVGRLGVVGERDTVAVLLNAGDVVDIAVFDTASAPFAPAFALLSPANVFQPGVLARTTGGMAGVRRGRITPGRTISTTGIWRVVIISEAGTGDYVFKVRRAGPVPVLETQTRTYLPVAVNAAAGSDSLWVFNAGTGALDPTGAAVATPWLAVANGSAGAGHVQAPEGPASLALGPPGSAPPPQATGQMAARTAGEEGPPQPVHPASVPLLLTATRGGRARGDHMGYLAVTAGDGWAGPAMIEVRMRVYEREVVFVTPVKMSSRPTAVAVAPEGDLAVLLANGQLVRMDPQTGSTRLWSTTSSSAGWWGISFAPDSSAYVTNHSWVTRVTKDGTSRNVFFENTVVFDVVVTPAGALFVATEAGLYRRTPAGVVTRLTTELTYGVAYSAADGMVYASVNGAQIRRVNPATGAVAASVSASDNSLQQQLEIGAGGVFYGRTNYLSYPDLRRFSASGQLERSWWTPQPFPQAIALAPDGTMYGTAGDRVFRLKVEGEMPPTHVAGDATGDGQVTAQDALAVLSAAVGKGLPDDWMAADGDANCDGQVTAQDALIILSHAVGKDVAQFCVGKPQP